MIIPNKKKPLVSMVYKKYVSAVRVRENDMREHYRIPL